MADDAREHSAEKAKEDTEVLCVDLPAPPGWQKKFMPKKGGTPRKNDIVFISPTGNEIKNKKQLDQYLKSHPGGPESSEFDWGTGDTPRRSARLSEKTKAVETPEGEKPKKREKKSSSKKGAKDNDAEEADDSAEAKKGDSEQADDSVEAKKDDTKEEIKVAADVEMKEAEETVEKVEGERIAVDKDGDAVDGTIEQDSDNRTEDVKEIPVESAEKKAAPKDASKVDITPSHVNNDQNEGKVGQGSENKTEGDVKEMTLESEEKKDAQGDASKVGIIASYGNNDPLKETDTNTTDSEAVPVSDPKEEASAENEEKGEQKSLHESHEDNKDTSVEKETPSIDG